jgi:hypothetical protein
MMNDMATSAAGRGGNIGLLRGQFSIRLRD